MTYGELARGGGRVDDDRRCRVDAQAAAELTLVGTPQNRVDALDIVTGRKQFAMDLDVPDALPTMVCRPPTINGTVGRSPTSPPSARCPASPTSSSSPPASRCARETFGQCIDAVHALDVTWGPGTDDGKSDDDVLAELRAAELPMAVPPLPLLTQDDRRRFTFALRQQQPAGDRTARSPTCAPDRAEIWSSLKSPIVAQQRIAARARPAPGAGHVPRRSQGGGSFGRHLFFDAALEAAVISQKMGKPVKLMWHRTDDFRQGRMHPMSTSRVRASYLGGQRAHLRAAAHERVHRLRARPRRADHRDAGDTCLGGNLGFAETIFELSQIVPYNFGVTTQLLNEIDVGFNTGSMRNIYSPNVTTAPGARGRPARQGDGQGPATGSAASS